jgi:biotin carboxylase
MAQPRRVLIVGGSQASGLFEAVERREARAVVLGIPEILERQAMPPCVEEVAALDLTQPLVSIVRTIRGLAEAHACAGIVPITEYALVPAAFVAQQLRLPGVPVKAVQNTRDKARMRAVLARAGLAQVRYAACRDLTEGQAFLESVGGPIIVKPILGTASDGVSRVDGPDQLAAAFALAGQARSFGGVLCEELVPGPEVSVEGYSVDGVFTLVAVTDKVTDERFLEVGHSQPSAHPASDQQAIAAFVAAALRALGVGEGVSHTEVKLTPAGPVLIETHTRMGGGNIHLLTRRTTGIDLADLTVGFALGEKPQRQPRPTGRGAAVRFLTSRPGRIASVAVPPLVDGIEDATVYVAPGAAVGQRSSSLDRLGHVVAVADSAASACRAAEAFRDRIVVRYLEEGEPWTAQVA